MLKGIKQFLGFVKEEDIVVSYPHDYHLDDVMELKLAYLKELERQENDRLNAIESKTAQLIGQSGIIFSLISLFIPTYIDKLKDASGWYQAILILVFLFTLLFYFLTIFHATRYLNIIKYKYAQRSIVTVKRKYESARDFNLEEIRDLIYSVDRNMQVSNHKADNLIFAYRSFQTANLFVGVLAVLLLASVFTMKQDKAEKAMIAQPNIIMENDSLASGPAKTSKYDAVKHLGSAGKP